MPAGAGGPQREPSWREPRYPPLVKSLPKLGLLLAALAAQACSDEGESDPDTASTTSAVAVSSSLASVGLAATSTGQGGAGTGGNGSGAGTGSGGEGAFELAFDPIELDTELNIVTEMRFVPGAPDEMIVLEKSGTVHHFRLEGDGATRLGGFTLEVHDDLDCGLISLAFSNDFEVDRGLYLGFCESGDGSRVDRVRWDASDYDAIPASAEPILHLLEPNASQPWHNVGSMGFEPDGTLWVLAGEKTVSANAQDLGNDLGKLVRVVPNPEGEGSTPAADNPFVDQKGRSPNLFAIGLRSPWKGARDRFGRYWFGDVGQDTWEEINRVEAPGQATAPQNFGWPNHEGPCDPPGDDCVEPVTYYGRSGSDPYLVDDPDHLSAGTRSVWVGPYLDPVEGDPYDGRLDDHLLFGDLHTGFVRMLHLASDGSVLGDRPVAHLNHGHAWDRGPGGYLHVMTFGTLLSTDTRTSELFRVRVE